MTLPPICSDFEQGYFDLASLNLKGLCDDYLNTLKDESVVKPTFLCVQHKKDACDNL